MPATPVSPWFSRRWIRWTGAFLLAALLLAGAAMFVLPWWLQGKGMAMLSQRLGREVTVQGLEVQPWRLGLEIHGLHVAGAPGRSGPPQLQVARIATAVSLRSLWERSLVLDGLRIEQPALRLTRIDSQHLDIDDLLQRLTQPSAGPAGGRFSLVIKALSLGDGRFMFDDRLVGRQHALSALNLSLPLLSLREADAGVSLSSTLGGQLDGMAFDASVQALPFAPRREARLALKFSGLDIVPWLDYLPKNLPIRINKGLLDADLQFHLAKQPDQSPELSLSGQMGAREVSLAQRGEPDWLSWQELQVHVKDLQPLKQRAQIDRVTLTAPRLQLRRNAAGQLRLPAFAAASGAKSTTVEAGWQLALEQLQLRDGQLRWQDEALQPAAKLSLGAIELQMSSLHWPLQDKPDAAGQFKLQASLQPESGKPAQLQAAGSLSAQALAAQGQWSELALETLSPYLQAQLPLDMRGRSAGRWQLEMAEPTRPRVLERLRLSLRDLVLDGVQARLRGGAELATLAHLQLDQARIDPSTRSVSLGKLGLTAPRLQLQRSANGRLNVQALLPRTDPKDAGKSKSSPAWALRLDEIAIDQGRLQFSDAAVQSLGRRDAGMPHTLLAERLQLRVRDLNFGSAGSKKPSQAQLSLLIGRGESRREGTTPGRLDWQGSLTLAPLGLSGKLRAERLPLALIDPYLDPGLHLHLRRGDAGFRGEVSLAEAKQGWRSQVKGALLVADMRLLQTREVDGRRQAGEEFLSWQSLELGGLDLALAPAEPARIDIGTAQLADFYARLIIDENGRFNLGELRPETKAHAGPAAASAVAETAQAAGEQAGLRLSVGETKLSNGSVDFSDRYIRPNYSARLTELAGSLGRFASGESAMAPLVLTGRVEGTGQLLINGQLNPSGTPLAMDITASASDIELAPLSPYAGKYAGYAIERGKLSSRVHYRIEPGGQLQADNQIILNQLTFGERIDSPSATKLPVLLAVALLKDRNGVIDINLPISGSIRDPQFSVGGLVVRLFINLIGKALTAPFSLLAGGGGPDLSQTEFAPGSARIEAAASQRLDRLAASLLDRPGLSVTLTGWAQPEAERAALQVQALDRALLAERRRELRRQQSPQARAEAEALRDGDTLPPADRQRLLAVLYKASNLPNRPRNFLGLLKDVPAAEMETMLLASYEIKPEAVRQLALARAVAVRDALIAKAVPNERLFLATPRLAESDPAQPWMPRVDLSLATH